MRDARSGRTSCRTSTPRAHPWSGSSAAAGKNCCAFPVPAGVTGTRPSGLRVGSSVAAYTSQGSRSRLSSEVDDEHRVAADGEGRIRAEAAPAALSAAGRRPLCAQPAAGFASSGATLPRSVERLSRGRAISRSRGRFSRREPATSRSPLAARPAARRAAAAAAGASRTFGEREPGDSHERAVVAARADARSPTRLLPRPRVRTR